ncbi:MAG: RNA methyltransferase [Thermoguttaceae bacterium]|nr:RNA methyltransferase [Thermoguttaceae bacterium]
MITSLTNPQVKQAVKLRDGKKRREDGLFLIDGRREIQRAIESGIEIAKIFYNPDGCGKEFTEKMFSSGAEMSDVSEAVLTKLAYGARDEGAVAVAKRPVRTLDSLKLSSSPLIGVAEGVEKPGNVGALLRSADGAGLDALILADCKTDLYNPNAVRASLGTVFSVPVVETTSQAAVDWLTKKGIVIFAAIVDGAIEYSAADYRQPSAIVVGSEADGLTDVWRGANVQPIFLPMNGIADSLNVSVTAGILFYHALTQRKKSAKR